MLALTKRNNLLKVLVAILAAAGLSLILSNPVSAQEVQLDDEPVIIDSTESEAEVESATDTAVPDNFEYTAVECNNLTLLVRRSIQIYDAETEGVSLTPADIIYAETNVTQQLGSFQLDIGQDVTIPRDLIAQYAESSAALTDAQRAAWDTYTPTVNFELDDIEPTNVEVAADNTIIVDESLSDQSPLTELETESEEDNASAVWWFVGIGAVLLLWYVLWRRPEDQSTTRSNP